MHVKTFFFFAHKLHDKYNPSYRYDWTWYHRETFTFTHPHLKYLTNFKKVQHATWRLTLCPNKGHHGTFLFGTMSTIRYNDVQNIVISKVWENECFYSARIQ